jgi:HEPN domain-containing protein
VIRQLCVTDGVQSVFDDLKITRSRLANEPLSRDVAPLLDTLLAELDALGGRSEAGGEVDDGALDGFVARANEERCKIFGELTARACAAGKGMEWAKKFFRPALRASTVSGPSTSTRREPGSADEWREVASERMSDARVLGEERPDSAGPVYMAGYAIECSLKAYLRSQNRSVPTRGAAGHDLRGLWEAAGFRLGDLKDDQGIKTFFIEHWSTDLRYEISTGSPLPTAGLLEGACKLMSWIQKQIKRARRSR